MDSKTYLWIIMINTNYWAMTICKTLVYYVYPLPQSYRLSIIIPIFADEEIEA